MTGVTGFSGPTGGDGVLGTHRLNRPFRVGRPAPLASLDVRDSVAFSRLAGSV